MNLYHDVQSKVDDFAVLFDFWKEGEATEEEVKEAYSHAFAAIEEAEFKMKKRQGLKARRWYVFTGRL